MKVFKRISILLPWGGHCWMVATKPGGESVFPEASFDDWRGEVVER